MEIDWPALLHPILVTVLTAVVFALVGRKNGRSPTFKNGLYHYRLPKGIAWFGGVAIVIAAFFALGGLWFSNGSLPMVVFMGLLAVGFGWMGVVLLRDGLYYQAACNEEILVVIDGRGRMESYAWGDIVAGKVHPLTREIMLRTKDGRSIKLHATLIGSDKLFEIMGRRTKLPVAELLAKARTHV